MRRKSLYYSIIVLRAIAQALPERLAQAAGASLGLTVYYLFPEYKKIALENLRLCFPEKSGKEISSLAKKAFENTGKNLFEVLGSRLNSGNIGEKVDFKGLENFEKSFAKKRGVLMLAAHFGNWEILGAALALKGIPLNVTAKKVYIEQLDRILLATRESKGMKIIKRGEDDSVKGILKALKRNEVLAILIDQNTKNTPGVYADFFGRKAYTPSGLAALALRTGAPVVPGFIVRSGNRHTVEIGEPIKLVDTGDYESDVRENTRLFNCVIESYVRRYPEQWVWFHRRWD